MVGSQYYDNERRDSSRVLLILHGIDSRKLIRLGAARDFFVIRSPAALLEQELRSPRPKIDGNHRS